MNGWQRAMPEEIIRTFAVAQVRHRCQYGTRGSVNCLATARGELLCRGGGSRRCSWRKCGVNVDELCQLRLVARSQIPARTLLRREARTSVKQVDHSEKKKHQSQ